MASQKISKRHIERQREWSRVANAVMGDEGGFGPPRKRRAWRNHSNIRSLLFQISRTYFQTVRVGLLESPAAKRNEYLHSYLLFTCSTPGVAHFHSPYSAEQINSPRPRNGLVMVVLWEKMIFENHSFWIVLQQNKKIKYKFHHFPTAIKYRAVCLQALSRSDLSVSTCIEKSAVISKSPQ